MSNKNTKNKHKKNINKRTNYEDVPTFKSPAKTLWGKILIIVIVFAMVILPVVALIITLATL